MLAAVASGAVIIPFAPSGFGHGKRLTSRFFV
jgi:hypothetical protein